MIQVVYKALCPRFIYNGLVMWKSNFIYSKHHSYHWICRWILLRFSNFELLKHFESPVLSFFVVDYFVKIYFFVTWYYKRQATCFTKSVRNSKKGRERTRFHSSTKENFMGNLLDPIRTPDRFIQKKAVRPNAKIKLEKSFTQTSCSLSKIDPFALRAGNSSIK